MIATINPATGETLQTFEPLDDAAIDEKLRRAAETFRGYRDSTFQQRAGMMLLAAGILESESEAFGRLMATEMGKTAKAGREEAIKCAWACRYYAERAGEMLADEEVPSDGRRSYIHYQPLGPVLAVMPWNFPFWQVFRFAAPALMAGNVGLLKHSSNVPRCALAIEDIFRRAGFPEGAFQTLLVGSNQVARILQDRRVAAVTLTGSEFAGGETASEAGKQIKKSVLELGGSDPFIVMARADVEQAASIAVKARIINNGQSCVAAKRFIVVRRIADEFERRFVQGMEAVKVGDPMDDSTELGPLATEDLLRTLDEQVRRSVEMGARVLTGGRRLDRPGNYYAPTVLADAPPDSPAFRDEIFGPVAALFRVRDIDEAIRLANATNFGLGSSVWTNDEAERARFIDELEAGMVFVNGMVASDPRLPFGGVKHSGFGRELGVYGIREFVNVKTVVIQHGRAGRAPATE